MKYVEFNKKVSTLLELVSVHDKDCLLTVSYDDNSDIHSELISICYYMYNYECSIHYCSYSSEYRQELTCSYAILDTSDKNNKYIDTKVTEFDTFEQLVDHVSTQNIINTLFS